MKKKFNLAVAFFVAITLCMEVTAQETTRRFSKSWPAGEIETLEIVNKFGEVKVSDKGGAMVTIEVVVTAEGSESRAKDILDDISVSFGQQGSKATAETQIASNFKSRSKFSIDYTVNIPADRNLNITNKFGNVVVQKLTGKGLFDIGYGNLTAGQLEGEGTRLDLAYGKADVESMKDARISLSYSRMFMKSAGNVTLESKYSTLNIDKMTSIKVSSKYDTFNFGTLTALEGDSKFSNYKIATIENSLKLASGYGTIRVEHIPADFGTVDINSSYAQISLGMDEKAAYQVVATCEYCSINYPQNNFSGNSMKENTKQTINGTVLGGSKGKVSVSSRYGNVKLGK